ncbi:MAG: 6-carboxytetrahydropterin synthase [Alphaproteobacteria bacterium]|nr:6-carboxytetrahydropterin synthase [Alphaproteobacteria bacterium]
MLTCTRSISFDAAHRIMNHESQCKMVHGHRYTIEATFQAKDLDMLGRVIDFGVIKTVLGQWILDNWDHTMILWEEDKALGTLITESIGQKIYYLPTNPTAENMAYYLLHSVCPSLFGEAEAHCVKIRLYETPNCYAECALWLPSS